MDITKEIVYAGVNDKDIDLFESQYVVKNGVSYNSYVILDEKITVMDTVDKRKSGEWIANLEKILGERSLLSGGIPFRTRSCGQYPYFFGKVSGHCFAR